MTIFPRKICKIGTCLAFRKEARGARKIAGPAMHDYPFVRFENEIWQAHRLSFHLNCRNIPRNPINRKRGLVLHTCDHKWCIEPNHLYYGTAKQNTKDLFDRHPTIHIKIAVAATNRIVTNETKMKMAKSHLGILHTKCSRRKISQSQYESWRKRKCA